MIRRLRLVEDDDIHWAAILMFLTMLGYAGFQKGWAGLLDVPLFAFQSWVLWRGLRARSLYFEFDNAFLNYLTTPKVRERAKQSPFSSESDGQD